MQFTLGVPRGTATYAVLLFVQSGAFEITSRGHVGVATQWKTPRPIQWVWPMPGASAQRKV